MAAAIATFTLTSGNGVQVRVCSYGAIIMSVRVPDRAGDIGEIALGHDTVDAYRQNEPYLGAVIGRYANRIAYGRFTLDGQQYLLARNAPPHHLHGGWTGFDRYIWDAEAYTAGGAQCVRLQRTSPAGEEGYPGTLVATVEYRLTSGGALHVSYEAATDAATIVNLTQHTYFNLSGTAAPIDDHVLTLFADWFTPVDTTLIPTGEVTPVAGTPFDFRVPHRIGDALHADDEQVRRAGGFDHNWVVNRRRDELAIAAELRHPPSGRKVTVETTEAGIQFYSGNFLDGTIHGRHGAYHHRAGLCLETQRFPNTPNEPAFGDATLRPGERYSSQTIFTFSAS